MRSRECEEIATRAPSATSSVAIPRPIPFDAPVTSATLPFKPRSMAGMLSGRAPPSGARREASPVAPAPLDVLPAEVLNAGDRGSAGAGGVGSAAVVVADER